MRRNVANTEAMISYQVTPSFITNGTVMPLQTLDHAQALALLATPDWTPPEPE
jgi:predicted SPOUT superfamily RNA methylase MTH1